MVTTMVSVQDVVDIVKEIVEDSTLPKNVKAKLEGISSELKETEPNLQPFVRTQIWSIVSMLESLD